MSVFCRFIVITTLHFIVNSHINVTSILQVKTYKKNVTGCKYILHFLHKNMLVFRQKVQALPTLYTLKYSFMATSKSQKNVINDNTDT